MSNEKQRQYPFHEIEPKWQAYWERNKTFRTYNPGQEGFHPSKPKFYVLDMFPYPSGEGLHVGHPEGYTATDIVARYRRKKGWNVLHPMGWDAFGLPAEQYAIKTGQHPRQTTARNIARFRTQLKRLGFCYDWDREIDTTDPAYYKWTQWIFLQIYNSYFDEVSKKARPIQELEQMGLSREEIDARRLAYVAEVNVNWCPGLGTVLANEEVIDGKSEIGGFPVERRPLRQWMLRITAYADRLIEDMEGLDWPEGIKRHQREWIGRSEGAEAKFRVEETDHVITVFTTRPDTLYGATYMVLAPEHPLVDVITTPEQRAVVENYKAQVANKSEMDRTALAKEKTGVPTGARAINPVNGALIPIWIADYVLISYGTGAIMAVPAHDERDFEFARQFNLPVIPVVQPPEGAVAGCYTGDGIAINSPLINGLPTQVAKKKIIEWLEQQGLGRRAVNYKLRDWLFARQRYWGEPFPIIWETDGRHYPVPESELPVVAPDLEDFRPTGTPEPPLSKAVEWVRYSETARRETNTMPQWAGSCWYYLRFIDPHNAERFVDAEAERYWMGGGRTPGGVDLYVGGTEHAVLHLLYARFWHKVLYDLGYVSTPEPFQKLVNQGLILGEDGQKMSKSRGNVINPDHVIDTYGADSLRLFEMFMGPLEQVKPWSTRGVEGVHRFLGRVWRLVHEAREDGQWEFSSRVQDVEAPPAMLRLLHQTIRKVSADIDSMNFNTAISQMMICVNELTAAAVRPVHVLAVFLHLLNPFAPHISEELYERLVERFPRLPAGPLSELSWPEFDPALLVEETVEIVVQVNGKVRDRLVVPAQSDIEALKEAALGSQRVKELTNGKPVKNVIVVPKRLVNIVIG